MGREDIFDNIINTLADCGIANNSQLDGLYVIIHTRTVSGPSLVRNCLRTIGLDVMKVQISNFKPGHYSIYKV